MSEMAKELLSRLNHASHLPLTLILSLSPLHKFPFQWIPIPVPIRSRVSYVSVVLLLFSFHAYSGCPQTEPVSDIGLNPPSRIHAYQVAAGMECRMWSALPRFGLGRAIFGPVQGLLNWPERTAATLHVVRVTHMVVAVQVDCPQWQQGWMRM